jgi:hypothetical protein
MPEVILRRRQVTLKAIMLGVYRAIDEDSLYTQET